MFATPDVCANDNAAAGVIRHNSTFAAISVPPHVAAVCGEYCTITCVRLDADVEVRVLRSGATVPAKTALPNAENRMSDFDNNRAKRGLCILPFEVRCDHNLTSSLSFLQSIDRGDFG